MKYFLIFSCLFFSYSVFVFAESVKDIKIEYKKPIFDPDDKDTKIKLERLVDLREYNVNILQNISSK